MYSKSVKRGVIVVFLFLILLSLIDTVQAFGVSTPYLEDDTLRVLPGQNYSYIITLQNGGEEDYYVDLEYNSTKNIASLIGDIYYVSGKTYNTTAEFIIHIPKNAEMDERYSLVYSAKPRTSSNGTVTFGVEIKRGITIWVTNETNTNIKPLVIPEKTPTAKKPTEYNKIILGAGKYILLALIIILIIFITIRLWALSKGISLKLSRHRKTNYTISQAINLAEVKILLHKISDEEYELPEIRDIFKNKISELTNNEIVEEIPKISRREAILALERILK